MCIRLRGRKEDNTSRIEKFEEDLEFMLSKLSQDMQGKVKESLGKLKDRLIELHRTNIVKINHSVMELVDIARALVCFFHDINYLHCSVAITVRTKL